ncbi:MAG: hypothetical protein KF819_28450 [Labilithrix sp.]|nr:hypothetical protein [Labilithrix sp.]
MGSLRGIVASSIVASAGAIGCAALAGLGDPIDPPEEDAGSSGASGSSPGSSGSPSVSPEGSSSGSSGVAPGSSSGSLADAGDDSGKGAKGAACEGPGDCVSGRCAENRRCVDDCKTTGKDGYYSCGTGGDDCCLGSSCQFLNVVEGRRCIDCVPAGGDRRGTNNQSCCSGKSSGGKCLP